MVSRHGMLFFPPCVLVFFVVVVAPSCIRITNRYCISIKAFGKLPLSAVEFHITDLILKPMSGGADDSVCICRNISVYSVTINVCLKSISEALTVTSGFS
jgi:hypothetical protein